MHRLLAPLQLEEGGDGNPLQAELLCPGARRLLELPDLALVDGEDAEAEGRVLDGGGRPVLDRKDLVLDAGGEGATSLHHRLARRRLRECFPCLALSAEEAEGDLASALLLCQERLVAAQDENRGGVPHQPRLPRGGDGASLLDAAELRRGEGTVAKGKGAGGEAERLEWEVARVADEHLRLARWVFPVDLEGRVVVVEQFEPPVVHRLREVDRRAEDVILRLLLLRLASGLLVAGCQPLHGLLPTRLAGGLLVAETLHCFCPLLRSRRPARGEGLKLGARRLEPGPARSEADLVEERLHKESNPADGPCPGRLPILARPRLADDPLCGAEVADVLGGVPVCGFVNRRDVPRLNPPAARSHGPQQPHRRLTSHGSPTFQEDDPEGVQLGVLRRIVCGREVLDHHTRVRPPGETEANQRIPCHIVHAV